MNCRRFAAPALALSLLSASPFAASAEAVVRQTQAVQAGAWQPLPAEAEGSIGDSGGALKLAFTGAKPLRLLLREPVPLPENVQDFAFSCTNNGANLKALILLLVRDAKGLEFAYVTRPNLRVDGVFYTTHGGHRSCEARHHTPGFTFADTRRTIRPDKPGSRPTPPLAWTGLLVEATKIDKGKAPEFYFRDFASSTLTPADSQFHYQFNDRECLGELDGPPQLTPGRYWWWPGTYRLSWDVRDTFTGQPFRRGGEEFLATENGDLPLALQLAKRLEIPVAEKGTYWVQVRVCRTDLRRNFKYYERVGEYEYRLDVLRGAPAPAQRTPAPPDAFTFIRIAPQRPDLIYEANEPFLVPVVFTRPQDGGQGYKVKVQVRSSTLGTVVASQEATPEWTADGTWTSTLDLAQAPAGGYVVQATMSDPQDHDFDTHTRLIARRADGLAVASPIPPGIVSARELLASTEPMFHLDATYEAAQWMEDPAKAWETAFRPFLDEAGTLSKDLELTVFWKMAEPVPGVFDWRDTDRFLDYAQQQGLRVLLRLDFRGDSVPEWIPPLFVRTRDGHVSGHTSYLFHGMQPDFFTSDELRRAFLRFQREAVAHFRSHPAVQGYYWVAEHPGDAPWNGFVGGYSEESVGAFRAWLRRQFATVAACNSRWGTSFADWNQIGPPEPEAAPGYRLDWLHFRRDAMDTTVREFVTQTRALDPVRLIMLYATRRDAAWFTAQGCMTANGGSHDAFMPGYQGLALDGFQMRNEEITPRAWSGSGPYQLDATLFHGTYAGGADAHCKAFIATWKRFADCQQPPASLGKYQDFQRLWRELRQTDPGPIESFILVEDDSQLLKYNTLSGGGGELGWPLNVYMAAYLHPALAGPEHWQHGKLLLATTENTEYLHAATIDQIVAYVKGGGQLYLSAEVGRYCLERPGEDWVLLRALGFAPPGAGHENAFIQARTPTGESSRLRSFWETPPQGDTLATFEKYDTPALSRQALGQGSVFVRWAASEVPPTHGGGHSLTAAVAELAGVRRQALADSPFLWTNLLKHRQQAVWYGLVYSGPWGNCPRDYDKPVAGRTWWPCLPDGQYRVTEMIHGRDLGTFSGEQLRRSGLPVTLNPREVALFRLEQAPATP